MRTIPLTLHLLFLGPNKQGQIIVYVFTDTSGDKRKLRKTGSVAHFENDVDIRWVELIVFQVATKEIVHNIGFKVLTGLTGLIRLAIRIVLV